MEPRQKEVLSLLRRPLLHNQHREDEAGKRRRAAGLPCARWAPTHHASRPHPEPFSTLNQPHKPLQVKTPSRRHSKQQHQQESPLLQGHGA